MQMMIVDTMTRPLRRSLAASPGCLCNTVSGTQALLLLIDHVSHHSIQTETPGSECLLTGSAAAGGGNGCLFVQDGTNNVMAIHVYSREP